MPLPQGKPPKREPSVGNIAERLPEAEVVEVTELRTEGLPLADTVAKRFRADAARFKAYTPVPTDPFLLDKHKVKYQPVPNDPIALEFQATKTLQSILNAGDASWWDEKRIATELRAIVEAPQIAELTRAQDTAEALSAVSLFSDNYNQYSGVQVDKTKEDEIQVELDRSSAQWLLDNPEFVTRYSNAFWTHILATPVTPLEGFGDIPGTDVDLVTNMTASLFKKHDSILTPELREFIIGNLALQPNNDQMALDAGVRFNHNTGLAWVPGQIVENWDFLWKAPGNFRGHINSPQEQTIALIDAFLSNSGELDSLIEKGRFADLLMSQTHGAVMDVANNDSGFMGFLDVAAGGAFTVTGNLANDWIYRVADPNDYINKQAFSIGHTFSIWTGNDPSTDYFRQVSGVADLQANMSPLDPVNVLAAFGGAIMNAARIPRIASAASKGTQSVSKANMFRQLLNPRSQMFRSLPIMDSGPMGRFFYTTMSKSQDQIFAGRRFQTLASRLAKATTEHEIERLAPSLKGSDRLVEKLAKYGDSPDRVTYYMKDSLYAPANHGLDDSYEAYRSNNALQMTTDNYRVKQQTWMDVGGSLGDLGPVDNVQAILVKDIIPEAGGDAAALKTVTRRSSRYTNSPIVDTVDIKGGRMVIRGSGDTIYGFDKDTGEFLGGIIKGEGINPTVGTAKEHQLRGVNKALRAQIPNYGAGRISMENVSDQMKAALAADEATLYRASTLTEDGTEKFAVSAIGGSENIVRLEDNIMDLAEYLENGRLTDDAALLAINSSIGGEFKLSDLSLEAKRRLPEYVSSRGGTVGFLGDEAILTNRGKNSLIRGTDGGGNGTAFYEADPDNANNLLRARREYHDVRSNFDSKLWLVSDPAMSLPNWTKRLRHLTTSTGTSGTMQGLRSLGFTMTNTLPTNIALTQRGTGARQLHNWIKFLGGTEEKAIFWSERFRQGNVGNRWQIVFDAFADLGEEIRNPMIRDGLIQFNEKSRGDAFFFDRNGNALGLVPDSGRVRPVTISQLTNSFVMPNPKELKRSVRRYSTARKLPARFKRGLLSPKTQKNRERIADRLEMKMKRLYGNSDVPKEDLMAMAYADVLGGEYGRANGLGLLSKSVDGLKSKVFQPFHNVFVVSQLAGRPIPWTSRILLEESFRAEMFGLPSVWRNQWDYAWDMWDAHGIRTLPNLLDAQSRQVSQMIDDLFTSTAFDIDEARKIIPDLPQLLDDAGINFNRATPLKNQDRIRVFMADLIGRELTGTSRARLGSDMNLPTSVVKRQSRIDKNFRQMARDGFDNRFRWDIDGAAIANRSVYQSFLPEVETARAPIEWSVGHMSTKMQRTYGYNWGTEAYNQLRDSITGRYGINRALSQALGQGTEYTAEKLMKSQQWPSIRHIVDEITQGSGFDYSEVQKAQWYLENITDEIVATLFDPLVKGDRAEKVRMLTEYSETGKFRVTLAGREHILDPSPSNYDGFVSASRTMAEDAYIENLNMPKKLAGQMDPRFGQKDYGEGVLARARQATDWVMDVAGERPTQYLHRQPAFKHIHGRWFRFYKAMGWEDEAAQVAASRKATEQVNYIFFDNKNIPAFLKSMNDYVPFFSAMFEVSSTWLYKIPSVDTLPLGYLHLGRRVQRTIRGLTQSGIVTIDPEDDSMTLKLTENMEDAQPIVAAVGSGMYKLADAPRRGLEHLAGLANFAAGGWDDGYVPADYSAWAKDGYQFAIGNPLDPTSTGVMAINQISAGLMPLYQLPAGVTASAIFALNDEKIDATGMTGAELVEARPDLDMAQIIRFNEDAIRELNGDEVFNRAIAYDWDIEKLKMPDKVKMPQTNLWETLIDNIWFPFGRHDSFADIGQTFYDITPSAMSYITRGLVQSFVPDEYGDWLEFFVGSQSMAATNAEVLSQLQIEEAETGNISRELALILEADKIIEEIGFTIAINDATGARELVDPEVDESAANQIQEIWAEASRLNTQTISNANNRAGGSIFLRGLMGMMGPATPRMWDKEQEQVAAFWAARETAEKAVESGELDLAGGLARGNIRTPEDMVRYASLVDAWLEDSSGDEAKLWLTTNYPGIGIYTQGKTHWGESGPPVYAQGFDEYNEQVERGEREVTSPEVYMARYWRTGISTDREQAIKERYGTDPVRRTQAILNNQEEYNTLIEDYNAAYDAIDFIDTHLFGGKYQEYRTKKLDDLSVYEVFEQRNRDLLGTVDSVQASLDYGALSPAERRQLLGYQTSAAMEQRITINELRQFEEDNPTYRNPTERLRDSYYLNVKDPYRAEVAAELENLETAKSAAEISLAWENVRKINDEWFDRDLTIAGPDGEPFGVPAPQVHTWNSRPQKDRQERLLSLLTKKPQWLSKFDVSVIAQEYPAANFLLPTSPEQREIYDWAVAEKESIRQEYLNAPEAKKSQYSQALSDVDKEVDAFLMTNGREGEVAFKEAVPMQKLSMIGILPQSLSGVIPVINQVIADLDSIEKSPLSNEGYRSFRAVKAWFVSDYVDLNPTAMLDLKEISWAMYGTKVDDAVLARMFQGELYGELE